ncbi:MAG: hypothetical protein ABH851_06880 [Methanobacteriota archaeon]
MYSPRKPLKLADVKIILQSKDDKGNVVEKVLSEEEIMALKSSREGSDGD